MSRAWARLVTVVLALALVAAACSSDSGDDAGGGSGTTTQPAAQIDYKGLGLWDDGACDPAKDPLRIGLITTFESPLITLKDQATALEVSAEAFNARGGANGSCIEVHTCDDGANPDQALGCARELEQADVVATVNDQVTAGAGDVAEALADAGIPRVATNVTPDDWADPNAYPLDASGTGVTFLLPQGLIDDGITKIGLVRVDLAAASAMVGLIGDLYPDASFPYDVGVPSGTTDFGQFVLGAEDAGVDGIVIPLGEQEAVQVLRAGQQLGTDLEVSASLGTFARANIADLGDFAQQVVLTGALPPATADVPVYEVLRDDLAASGDEALQPDTLKTSPVRSWIGLYALLKMIRDDGMTTFTGDAITTMLQSAKDVPMLDIFGGEDWTPDTTTDGIWTRKGIDRWTTWRWDPSAEFNGSRGNLVQAGEVSFTGVLCGSPFGSKGPC